MLEQKREEIILGLVEFFKIKNVMSREEYRKDSSVPYTMRDIEKVFTDYAEVLYLVNQRLISTVKVEVPEQPAPAVIKKPVKRNFKRAKEDSLDE